MASLLSLLFVIGLLSSPLSQMKPFYDFFAASSKNDSNLQPTPPITQYDLISIFTIINLREGF